MHHVETAAMKHLEHLCVEIGPRPVGSKENQAAADYIRRAFEAIGLEVEMQEFLCPLWEEIETQLEVGGEKLPAFANTWSPSCDVVATAVALGTVAELEAAELADRVGVLYGDLTTRTSPGAASYLDTTSFVRRPTMSWFSIAARIIHDTFRQIKGQLAIVNGHW